MFNNYLKIAFRNLTKQKSYSIINLLGLAIGMTCFLLISLYIQKELNYDTFHKKSDRIYRIAIESKRTQGNSYRASTPFPVVPVLRGEYPEIEKVARVYFYGEALINVNNKKNYDDNFVFAEPEFFDIFSFPLIRGNPENILSEPNTVVLTQSTAEKYFGDGDPIGKVFRFENLVDFTVTGIVADVPSNSHFRFNFLASFANVNEEVVGFEPEQWGAFFGIYSYALLKENVNITEFGEKIKPFYNEHAGANSRTSRRLFLQPITDIHLYSHLESEIEANNSPKNLFVLGTIALFILLIACINFMNLSTARSARRAKEVGMRKVLGAIKGQLLKQFLGESILLSFLALILSLGLVELMLPLFSNLTGNAMEFDYRENLISLAAILGMAVMVGTISGIYPAFILSSFNPVESLKGLKNPKQTVKNPLVLRKILVVSQFTISVILIAGTLIIHEQLSFFKEANLGFDKDLTVVIPMYDDSMSKQYDVIKNEFQKHPGVSAVTTSFKAPIGSNNFRTSLYPNGFEDEERFSINVNSVDYNFLEKYGLKLIAGRNFSPEFSTDTEKAFIVNEATIRKLGLVHAEEAIGMQVGIGINDIQGTIIGVTEDFHIQSLHNEITPLVMMYWPEIFNSFSVKISATNISETLTHLEETWQKFSTAFPFQYRFLDEYINGLYQVEEENKKIIGTFSMIAILIACLGLFGLAAYSTEQRTKEIGIRKTLGASVANIIQSLTSDFIKQVIVANFIAWPVAWFSMNLWLNNFAYRIHISVWTFILAGGIALFIALCTVSFQAIKAAVANPVESLRYE